MEADPKLRSEEVLCELARSQFGALSPLESALILGAGTNQTSVPSAEAIGDVTQGNLWGEDRTLRADILRWLCADPPAAQIVGFAGVNIIGAKVQGELILSLAQVRFPLALRSCYFSGGLNLSDACLRSLDLTGSHCAWINGDLATIERSLSLGGGFHSRGEVKFGGATIGGEFNARGGQFSLKGGVALFLDGTRVGGKVLLDLGFRADGAVSAVQATIGHDLSCRGGRFFNRGSVALALDEAEIRGRAFLDKGFRSTGKVSLTGASIAHGLFCHGGVFGDSVGPSLAAENLECGRDLGLGNVVALGPVILSGARIQGDLVCGGSYFRAASRHKVGMPPASPFDPARDCALLAQTIHVGGVGHFGDGFVSEGAVDLTEASFGKSLLLGRSTILGHGGKALCGDGLNVGGSMRFDNQAGPGASFSARGEVRLQGATIGSDLSFTGAKLEPPVGEPALWAEGIKVGRFAFFEDGFQASGPIMLAGAEIAKGMRFDGGAVHSNEQYGLHGQGLITSGSVSLGDGFRTDAVIEMSGCRIGGDLDLSNAAFVGLREDGLVIRNATVQGTFRWTNVAISKSTRVDLAFATIGQLADDDASWPSVGNLNLQGCSYREIPAGPKDGDSRLDWLRRLPSTPFLGQPYDEASRALRASGYADEARAIHIAREKGQRERVPRRLWGTIRSAVYGATTAYGYRPFHALRWAAAFVALGALVFGWAFGRGLMIPVRTPAAVAQQQIGSSQAKPPNLVFAASLYSLDIFLPVIDLYQKAYWLPDAGSTAKLGIGPFVLPAGSVVLCWLCVEKLAGWTLTTLFLAGLSGLVRRE